MTTESVRAEQPHDRSSGPVHAYFGLTYANFLVIHRAQLQSMPLDWQKQFVELLEDLNAAYAHLGHVDFEVKTVRDSYVDELAEDEMKLLGIACEHGEEADAYTDKDGNEMAAGWAHVGVPVPDPIPHYKHAYLPPDEAAIESARAARRF